MIKPGIRYCVACVFLPVMASMGCASRMHTVATFDPMGEERPHLANIRQLTSQDMGLFKAGEAYFSPDQKTIILQAFPMGRDAYQIYTMDLKTGELRMVSTGKGDCTCAYFHPSGRKILFASTHLAANEPQKDPEDDGGYKWSFHEHMDIFEADLDGSNLRRITDAPGYDAEGSYSTDGTRIVFTSQRDGDLEIYTMRSDGTEQKRITYAAGYDGGPFYSPDGKTILYRADHRNDGKMNLQLRAVDADGQNDRAITDNAVFNWCPFWHPNGNSFIFTQADHAGRPNYDLYMTTLDGDRFIRITYDASFDGLPVFSPDGMKLMWTSKRGDLDEAQVFIADFTLPPALSVETPSE